MKTVIWILLLVTANNIHAFQRDSWWFSESGRVKDKTADSLVISFLKELNISVTTDNEIKILASGEEKFTDLFAAIKTAKHHIHLEYFNFRNDSIAATLFDSLALKAKEGVKIRALFDAFGNWSNNRPLKKRHLEKLREKGIEIVEFDPLRFPYLNHALHRDHRKIVVIDGKVAYTGGMNIADYYIQGLPEIGEWRDMHVRIEGSAVAQLQEIFLDMWNKTAKQNVSGEIYFPQIADSVRKNGRTVAIVDREPRQTPKNMRRIYAKSIEAATNKIQVINPYFLPTHSIKKALRKALKRGVEVEIMISAKSDIKFTPEGSLYIAKGLMKQGAKVYLYKRGFHHSKIMMVDDAFCTIGSTNLNSRSLRYDYEVNAFIFDKQITAQLTAFFERDKTHSALLTKSVWKKRSVWKRFVGWFAHLFTPVL